jgi:hypothetical protein
MWGAVTAGRILPPQRGKVPLKQDREPIGTIWQTREETSVKNSWLVVTRRSARHLPHPLLRGERKKREMMWTTHPSGPSGRRMTISSQEVPILIAGKHMPG